MCLRLHAGDRERSQQRSDARGRLHQPEAGWPHVQDIVGEGRQQNDVRRAEDGREEGEADGREEDPRREDVADALEHPAAVRGGRLDGDGPELEALEHDR